MSEMIDRVARAIEPIILAAMSHHVGRDPGPIPTVQNTVPLIARAAIEAMRVPSDRMLADGRSVEVAGDEANREIGWVADTVWETMIDAALAQAQEGAQHG